MSTSQLQEVLKATLWIYKECGKRASDGLRKNSLILVGSIAAFVIFMLARTLLAPLGMLGGLLAGLVSCVLVSLYYGWISETYRGGKLELRDLYQIDVGVLLAVINVGFVLFVVQYIAASLLKGLDADWILYCLRLGLVLVFNAIPETVIVHRFDGTHALAHSAKFTRENWIEWYLPFIVIAAPWLAINPMSVLVVLTMADPLLPVSVLMHGALVVGSHFGSVGYLLLVIAIVVANWFMIFRAHLFQELESGSRRQRMFRVKQG